MLYIHVPFCQSRCIYCDFYSTTQTFDLRQAYADALCNEMALRAGELNQNLPDGTLRSIYLGGGTPSQLGIAHWQQIFCAIDRHFQLAADAEVTLEANPDDLTDAYIAGLRTLPVNRISLGIQSFHDQTLRLFCRRHSAAQAIDAVWRLHQAGFTNLSIDLIYGHPGQTLAAWLADLEQAFQLPITHLSAYALSVEEGTPLHRMVKSGQLREADDETSLAMYNNLMERADEAGFEHYEISNFARQAPVADIPLPAWGHFRAVHNSGYWQDVPYLGLGPGAHSYNLRQRRWNAPDLQAYLAANGDTTGDLGESEELTDEMRVEETLLRTLRTAEGLHLPAFAQRFGDEAAQRVLRNARPHVQVGRLAVDGDRLHLTRQGIFTSDDIISDLFI